MMWKRTREKFKGCFMFCCKFGFFKSKKNTLSNKDVTTVFLQKQSGFSHLWVLIWQNGDNQFFGENNCLLSIFPNDWKRNLYSAFQSYHNLLMRRVRTANIFC